MTDRPARRSLVVLLVGVVLGLVLAGGYRTAATLVTPRVTAEVCAVDPTRSGFQGWCVQRREPALPWSGRAVEVWIVGRFDGADSSRATVLPLPAGRTGRFEVTFPPEGIDVTVDGDVVLRVPRSAYELD